jgi:ribosome biogenesis GTPase A
MMAGRPVGVAVSQRDRPRAVVGEALDELLSLAPGLASEAVGRDLEAAHKRLAEDRLNLVVLGEFKRGKSTLINGLLGRRVLPTGVVPLTSVVTTIEHGARDRLVVQFHDGRDQDVPLERLSAYVTEASNPHNRLGVAIARVQLDHELIRSGVSLVDTPGVGSILSHNTDTAREFLGQVDGALCVLDAGQPLTKGERDWLREVADRVPRMLLLVNKIDHLEPADRVIAVDFVRSAVPEVLGDRSIEVFAVSAREGDGLDDLAERLRRIASDERTGLLVESVAALVAAAAGDVAQAAAFEARAITLPLDDLAARGRLFEQRITDLYVACQEAGDLLSHGTALAIEEFVNRPLIDHARNESERLKASLHRRVSDLGPVTARELSGDLETWIDDTIRSEFQDLVARFESEIAGALTDLERRHAARVQKILEDVQAVAEDVFGTRARDALPQTGLRVPTRFTFKLNDVENALDMIVGRGRRSTPGPLGRRLVVRDAETRLIDMTDRHAGRLRSELAERVTAAARDYRRELATSVEEAVGAIRGAIDRATADRREGERHSRERLNELRRIEDRCRQLAGELRSRDVPTAQFPEST